MAQPGELSHAMKQQLLHDVRKDWEGKEQWVAEELLALCKNGMVLRASMGGFDVAIKRVKRNRLIEDITANEILIGTMVKPCPYAVGIEAHWNESNGMYTCMAMPFCADKDLSAMMQEQLAQNQYIPQEVIMCILAQTTLSVDFSHSKGILHRDIKPQNVFMHADGYVMLADWDLATLAAASSPSTPGGKQFNQDTVGTRSYFSPEMLEKDNGNLDITYGESIDVWGLGITVYSLCMLQWNYNMSIQEFVAVDALPDIPACFDPELNTLIKWMMKQDPRERATIQQVLRAPCMRPYVIHACQQYDSLAEAPVYQGFIAELLQAHADQAAAAAMPAGEVLSSPRAPASDTSSEPDSVDSAAPAVSCSLLSASSASEDDNQDVAQGGGDAEEVPALAAVEADGSLPAAGDEHLEAAISTPADTKSCPLADGNTDSAEEQIIPPDAITYVPAAEESAPLTAAKPVEATEADHTQLDTEQDPLAVVTLVAVTDVDHAPSADTEPIPAADDNTPSAGAQQPEAVAAGITKPAAEEPAPVLTTGAGADAALPLTTEVPGAAEHVVAALADAGSAEPGHAAGDNMDDAGEQPLTPKTKLCYPAGHVVAVIECSGAVPAADDNLNEFDIKAGSEQALATPRSYKPDFEAGADSVESGEESDVAAPTPQLTSAPSRPDAPTGAAALAAGDKPAAETSVPCLSKVVSVTSNRRAFVSRIPKAPQASAVATGGAAAGQPVHQSRQRPAGSRIPLPPALPVAQAPAGPATAPLKPRGINSVVKVHVLPRKQPKQQGASKQLGVRRLAPVITANTAVAAKVCGWAGWAGSVLNHQLTRLVKAVCPQQQPTGGKAATQVKPATASRPGKAKAGQVSAAKPSWVSCLFMPPGC